MNSKDNIDYKKLGEHIRSRRLDLNMSQEQLAEKSGLSTTQNKYEFLIEKHIKPELSNVKLDKISSAMIKTQCLSNFYVRTMAIIIKSALELSIKEQFALSIIWIYICQNKASMNYRFYLSQNRIHSKIHSE